MIKIKSCPLCGGKAYMDTEESGYGARIYYYIQCDSCQTRTMSDKFKAVVLRIWNKRHYD